VQKPQQSQHWRAIKTIEDEAVRVRSSVSGGRRAPVMETNPCRVRSVMTSLLVSFLSGWLSPFFFQSYWQL
jgi:hypothetical protein